MQAAGQKELKANRSEERRNPKYQWTLGRALRNVAVSTADVAPLGAPFPFPITVP